jgi:hypothetical protein
MGYKEKRKKKKFIKRKKKRERIQRGIGSLPLNQKTILHNQYYITFNCWWNVNIKLVLFSILL